MEQIDFLKPVEVKKVKKIIKDVYAELGIKRSAKSTELDRFFYTKVIVKNSVRYVKLIKARLVQ